MTMELSEQQKRTMAADGSVLVRGLCDYIPMFGLLESETPTQDDKCNACPRELCRGCCDVMSQEAPSPADWGRRLHGLSAPREALAVLARRLHDELPEAVRQANIARLHISEVVPPTRGRREDAGEPRSVEQWAEKLHD